MNSRACPFCGVATDVPHNTQAGCIEALQEEITRTRAILEHQPMPNPESAEVADSGTELA